jgi:hypothetical protein
MLRGVDIGPKEQVRKLFTGSLKQSTPAPAVNGGLRSHLTVHAENPGENAVCEAHFIFQPKPYEHTFSIMCAVILKPKNEMNIEVDPKDFQPDLGKYEYVIPERLGIAKNPLYSYFEEGSIQKLFEEFSCQCWDLYKTISFFNSFAENGPAATRAQEYHLYEQIIRAANSRRIKDEGLQDLVSKLIRDQRPDRREYLSNVVASVFPGNANYLEFYLKLLDEAGKFGIMPDNAKN